MSPAVLIREARKAAGLTQSQLAERAGTSQPLVARLERGRGNPTIATVDRMLQAAGHRLTLQAAPHPPSIDETQIAERLRLTPAERLDAFVASRRNVGALLRSARRRPRDDR